MKEKDFSGADLPFPLFSLEASVQLAFLTLIEAQKSSRELHLRSNHKHPFLLSIQSFTRAGRGHWHEPETQKSKMEESSRYVNDYLTIIYYMTDWRTINP